MNGNALVIVGVWILCGLAAGWIAQQKGRSPVEGFGLGALLGPLGVVLALIAKPIGAGEPAGPDWGHSATPPAAPALGCPAQPAAAFCPRCGTARAGAFRYCRSCGLDFDA